MTKVPVQAQIWEPKLLRRLDKALCGIREPLAERQRAARGWCAQHYDGVLAKVLQEMCEGLPAAMGSRFVSLECAPGRSAPPLATPKGWRMRAASGFEA